MRLAIHLIVFTFLMAMSFGAAAPPAPPAAPPAAPPSGGRSGQFGGTSADPLRFRQLTMTTLREKLAVDDEQWKLLWPKIEKVLQAQRNARTGAAMSISSPAMIKGTPPPNVLPPQRAQNSAGVAPSADTPPAERAMQQIRAALDKPVSDADLLEKLTTMRAARDTARAELAAAQTDLRNACSTRQEAVLVTLGLLE